MRQICKYCACKPANPLLYSIATQTTTAYTIIKRQKTLANTYSLGCHHIPYSTCSKCLGPGTWAIKRNCEYYMTTSSRLTPTAHRHIDESTMWHCVVTANRNHGHNNTPEFENRTWHNRWGSRWLSIWVCGMNTGWLL